MEFLLFDIIQAGFGRLYLLLRYRKKELINKALEEKYEGSYSNAGKAFSLNIIVVLFVALLLAFLLSVALSAFR